MQFRSINPPPPKTPVFSASSRGRKKMVWQSVEKIRADPSIQSARRGRDYIALCAGQGIALLRSSVLEHCLFSRQSPFQGETFLVSGGVTLAHRPTPRGIEPNGLLGRGTRLSNPFGSLWYMAAGHAPEGTRLSLSGDGLSPFQGETCWLQEVSLSHTAPPQEE